MELFNKKKNQYSSTLCRAIAVTEKKTPNQLHCLTLMLGLPVDVIGFPFSGTGMVDDCDIDSEPFVHILPRLVQSSYCLASGRKEIAHYCDPF